MNRHVLFLIAAGLVSSACASAEPTFQPVAVIVLSPQTPGEVDPEYLDAARLVLQQRLDAVIASKSSVSVEGQNLKIELGNRDDAVMAGWLATQVGIIEFWSSPAPVAPDSTIPSGLALVMNGLDISQARAEKDQAGNNWQVVVQFTPAGTQKMAQFTASNVGQYLVISRDSQVIAAPYVQAPIAGGQAVIAGVLNEISAKSLAAVLNSGALPVPLIIVAID